MSEEDAQAVYRIFVQSTSAIMQRCSVMVRQQLNGVP